MIRLTQILVFRICCIVAGLCLISGCSERRRTAAESAGIYDAAYSTGEITFLDQVLTNVVAEDDFGKLVFQDIEGKEHSLEEFGNGKALVVVITRGYTDPICPYCSTQVARLIDQYAQITTLNAEVVVVYPIAEQKDGKNLDAFLAKSREQVHDPDRPVPFPVLLDMQLTNVNRLGIRKDLSKPATYIIDVGGQVRFAYIGDNLADRPSVAAVLAELQKLADKN